jgi:molybdopterin synthase sulfur carrier subunit
MITVLFFGPVADRVGANRMAVAYRKGLRLGDLRAELAQAHPDAFEIVSMTAVDGARVSDPAIELADASEIVFMSKFSGG